MYFSVYRGYLVLAYTLVVLAIQMFACFLSTILVDYRTGTEMKTLKVEVTNDLGHITFNFDTDILF
ncbi:PREDICTED: signal peptidase complex subunit 3-like [Diuraphis noxia]|uniref:signal peptidase complex subunit 3-like n=1 Tax=Diuraphis noxia TaxID=143948 RepID=UPI00076358D3|nr:PREDICTED: signal peptidase complex subunit 3-like [Diuraphis noxia]